MQLNPYTNHMVSPERAREIGQNKVDPRLVVDIISGRYADEGKYVAPSIVRDLMKTIAGSTDKTQGGYGENAYIQALERMGVEYDPAWFSKYIKPGQVAFGTYDAINNYLTAMGPGYGYDGLYDMIDQYSLRSGIPRASVQRYLDGLDEQRLAMFNRVQWNPFTRQYQALEQDYLSDLLEGQTNMLNAPPVDLGVDESLEVLNRRGIPGVKAWFVDLGNRIANDPVTRAVVNALSKAGSDTTLPTVGTPETQTAVGLISGQQQGSLSPFVSRKYEEEARMFNLDAGLYAQFADTMIKLAEDAKNNPALTIQIWEEIAKLGLDIPTLDRLKPDWWVNHIRPVIDGTYK